MATDPAADATSVADIPAEYYDMAREYIVAIVSRDLRSAVDGRHSRRLAASLWNQFFAEYASSSSSPHAKHGREAVRLALSRI